MAVRRRPARKDLGHIAAYVKLRSADVQKLEREVVHVDAISFTRWVKWL